MIKKLVLISAAFTFCASLQAQNDTLSLSPVPVKLDSSCLGLNIFDSMPSAAKGDASTVTISQSEAVRKAVEKKISSNMIGEIPGYRIRIFFSNAQNAREASLSALSRFEDKYPEHRAYRIYVLPDFKVTVGDFRTKSDALKLLDEVKKDFPSAFIVRENINLSD